ncbi:MAG: formyltransferase [Synergistaceae bacterium]|nr:formyltransferase [Synergistaceae bacterium]
MKKAVVFAYSSVGYECLSVLIKRGVNVALVYTHEDDPGETQWFESVYQLAKKNNIPVKTSQPDLETVKAVNPDVIFSFYYRAMIDMKILSVAPLGAFNMHGSLLPRYRGRACVNWAVLNGEKEAGVTLHHMTARADQGNIVDQEAVSIGPDETAHDVFLKIIPAAARVIDRSLEKILTGNAQGVPQDESKATKFGRRRPEDGLIDWTKSAQEIHNLVRAVAKPFPGAFTFHDGKKIMIWKTSLNVQGDNVPGILVRTGDGLIEILEWEIVDIKE